jgi:hypothetical protein
MINRAKELKLVIKADVTGSAEAVAGALQGIGNNKAVSKVISSNVGDVTEGDVTLAKAIGGALIPSLISSLLTLFFISDHHCLLGQHTTSHPTNGSLTKCEDTHLLDHLPPDGRSERKGDCPPPTNH